MRRVLLDLWPEFLTINTRFLNVRSDPGHEASISSHNSSVPSHEARYLRFKPRGQDFLISLRTYM